MNQYFYSYNFTHCFNSVDTEFIWDQLKTAIYNALNQYVPSIPIKTTNQPKWFTPPIRHEVNACIPLKEDLPLTHQTKKLEVLKVSFKA